ncbi:MAG TPA: zinc-finger domain-containing protein [Thiobacillaceae bacterium]|nr:zinc-finger domain-containing protein [Thiobacillaceae bacterium]
MSESPNASTKKINTRRVIEIGESDLPLRCPMPQHSDWDAHPRVYLPIEPGHDALCPYCGTLYRLKGRPSGGHF